MAPHQVEELVDAVAREVGIERVRRPGRVFGVPTMDRRLLCLTSRPDAAERGGCERVPGRPVEVDRAQYVDQGLAAVRQPRGEGLPVEVRIGLVRGTRFGWRAVGRTMPRPAMDDAHMGGELAQVPARAAADGGVERATPDGGGETIEVLREVPEIPVALAVHLCVHGPR